MQPYLEKTFLLPAGHHNETEIYRLDGGQFINNYFRACNINKSTNRNRKEHSS